MSLTWHKNGHDKQFLGLYEVDMTRKYWNYRCTWRIFVRNWEGLTWCKYGHDKRVLGICVSDITRKYWNFFFFFLEFVSLTWHDSRIFVIHTKNVEFPWYMTNIFRNLWGWHDTYMVIRVSQKTQHFVCASFSHSLMSLESQYGNKNIFSHQFQIYVKLDKH